MCFCFTSNDNCHLLFFGKTVRPQNGLLIFLGKETHSETNSWKSSRILRLNPNVFIFLSFIIISLHFIFFIFSFFHVLPFFLFCFLFLFLFFSFSIIFYHFLSFSFIFFHFLSFALSLLGAQNLIFFLGLNFVTISLNSSYVKNQF